MSLGTIISLGLILLFGTVVVSLIQRWKKSQEVTLNNLMDKFLGANPGLISIPTVDGYSIMDLLLAARSKATPEMIKEYALEDRYHLGIFLKKLNSFGSPTVWERKVVDDDGDISMALLNVYKGKKFFSVAFKVKTMHFQRDKMPDKFLTDIVTIEGKEFMPVIYSLAICVGEDGFEEKEKFIEELLETTRLPIEPFQRINFKRSHFYRFSYPENNLNLLTVTAIDIDPTKGYDPLYEGVNLQLLYHDQSYLLSQTQLLPILARDAIISDRSTILLEGAPNSGKTAFAAHLQAYLSQQPEVESVILATGEDLKALAGKEGKNLINWWTISSGEKEEDSGKLRVIFVDDASGIIEDPEHTQSLLSLMDGQDNRMANVVMVLSINRSTKNVPQDLLRPGRVSVRVHFGDIGYQEAQDLAKYIENGLTPPKVIHTEDLSPNKTYLVGEVYQLVVNENIDKLGATLDKLNKPEDGATETATKVAVSTNRGVNSRRKRSKK